jgi:thiamine-triphosphatase
MVSFSSTIRLEVVRKFAALEVYPLRTNSGKPPFLSLSDLGRLRFQDVYYDSEGRLSQAGVWLRQRDGKWEMKLRRGGTYANSRFEESSDLDIICAHVKSLTGLEGGASKSFGLNHLATLSTLRHSWIADNEYKVVLDQTDFGHVVGEVELEADVRVPDEAEAQTVMQEMDDKIAEFLRHYTWAFSNDKPVGKLSAYFAHQAQQRS